jgi:hypothetical protein
LCGGVADKGVLERLQVWKMSISHILLKLLIFFGFFRFGEDRLLRDRLTISNACTTLCHLNK